MLTLDLEKEGFKRYDNGKGYLITVNKEKSFISYNVFNKDDTVKNYLPKIHTDYCVEPTNENYFFVGHTIYLEKGPISSLVSELELYIAAYKVAQESIEEFQKAILNGEI